jgi:hypothetical protein
VGREGAGGERGRGGRKGRGGPDATQAFFEFQKHKSLVGNLFAFVFSVFFGFGKLLCSYVKRHKLLVGWFFLIAIVFFFFTGKLLSNIFPFFF